MLQSRKAKEPSTFTLVPAQPGSAKTPPVSFQSEGRATQPMIVSSAQKSTTSRSKVNRKLVFMGAAAAVLLAASWLGYEYLTVGRFVVTTDDAYVRAHNTTLASKISGYVDSIPIEDNAHIRAGDVIATIDDGDYRLAADAARDKVATEQATVDRIGRQYRRRAANLSGWAARL